MPAAKNRNKRKRPVGKPKKNLKHKNNRITAPLLITGVVLVLVGVFRQLAYNRALAPVMAETENNATNGMAVVPQRIVIADKIDIPLDSAILAGNSWKVSPNHGTYLVNSARLGEGGNMIIYGHNLRTIFGNLKQIKNGDLVKLYNQDGGLWTYKVIKTVVVNPTDTSWLQKTDIPTLTIYTCTGILDSQRLIVRAVPVKT